MEAIKKQWEKDETLAAYEITKQLGEGAYGVVVAAKVRATQEKVAVKKIRDAVEDKEQGKLLLRELKLLRHFRGHENVVYIKEIIESPKGQSKFKDIYIITDLMDTDLHRIIKSTQPLSDDHVRYFAYQILRGLKYLHSANVMHRDLKPNNLLVNANCDLKICDLGLARLSAELESSFMTVYVVTRWYRAPELLLGKKDYDKSIDMWAVGCILAELLGRKPLFPGKDYVDMLKMIVTKIGNPPVEDQGHVSEKAKKFLEGFPRTPPVDWKTIYPAASDPALDLLKKLLEFNPKKRLTPAQALEHPYMAELHDPDDEPECDAEFDFDYEKKDNLSDANIRELVFREISLYTKATATAKGKGKK